MAETIEVLVEGGKASAGVPLGPALGPMGINVVQVVQKINEKTKSFEGMKVPVKVIVDPKTKAFEIKVGTPPTSSLIFKEIGAEKGSGTPNKSKAGNLTMDQVIKIAGMKQDSLMGKSLKNRAMEVIGVCVSGGVTVEGKDAKAIQKEIREGKWDAKLAA
ncbi:MAG TPA: 50S ribosomal protein L11 [Methanomassiliicoccales archaeon]|nr:50S ribosomal protein L11 [Methanomassiliicoccales archaeon]